MSEVANNERETIEAEIARLRRDLTYRIDQLDTVVHQKTDRESMLGEHSGAILGSAAAVGFLAGLKISPRALLIGGLAAGAFLLKKRMEERALTGR